MALYLGSNKVSMSSVLSGLNENIAHASIPDYIKTAVLEVAQKVQAKQTSESITFIAMSDAHQLDTNSSIVNGNLHAGMAAKVLAYVLPNIDFCCYLGDYTAGSSTTTIEEGRQHLAEINSYIDEAFYGIPQFRTVGNHDALAYSQTQNGATITDAELFNLIGSYCSGATYGSQTGGYCYRDFGAKKLRVICLNTSESLASYNPSSGNVSTTQALWFAKTLREVGTRIGWKVLTLSHHPLDWGSVGICSSIVKKYIDGAGVAFNGTIVEFRGSNNAQFLGAFHGHVHNFKAAKLNFISGGTGTELNVWRIAIPNMCFARNNEYGQNGTTEYFGIEFGETMTYNKTANSANDTSFVVNVVNPSEQKIYSYCYGAGYDREISIKAETIAVTGVNLSASSGELTIGGSVTLTATVTPSTASSKTITWTSSVPTVASVSNGLVTALAAGSTVITATTADGGFTASYNLTVKAAAIDLLATCGYTDNTRLSTSSGSTKSAAGYVTVGTTNVIDVSKQTYPNGAIIRVTGAVNCKGNDWSTSQNGGDSAYVIYGSDKTTFSASSYIQDGACSLGTFTIDSDKTGFTLDIATLSNRYMKFCVKGTGANLTVTLTPK